MSESRLPLLKLKVHGLPPVKATLTAAVSPIRIVVAPASVAVGLGLTVTCTGLVLPLITNCGLSPTTRTK